MSDKKTKFESRLMTRGTDRANAKVVDDLSVSDPEPSVGKQVIEEAIEKDVDDDSEQEDS